MRALRWLAAGATLALLAGCGGQGAPESLDGREVADELAVVAKSCNAASYFAAEEALQRLERLAEKDPQTTISAPRAVQGELGRLERGLRYPLTARPIGRTIGDDPTDAGTITDVLRAAERTYGPCLEGSALDGLRAALKRVGR